jgi:hypothetical protein
MHAYLTTGSQPGAELASNDDNKLFRPVDIFKHV